MDFWWIFNSGEAQGLVFWAMDPVWSPPQAPGDSSSSSSSSCYTEKYMKMSCLSLFHWTCKLPTVQFRPQTGPETLGNQFSNSAENGPEVVPRWSGNGGALFSTKIILFQQEHACLPGSWSSARIIILCQDHGPLPRSWSSARNMILPAKIGLVLLHK